MPALSNKLVVALANDYTVLRFPVESFKLGQNDGTLRLIHAPTDAYPGMHITFALAVHAYFPTSLCDIFVVGIDSIAVAATT